MPLDRESPTPLYHQLAAVLRLQILDGARKLPSITRLASEHGLAEMTVRQAFDVLKTEGLVESAPGKGMYVVQRGQPIVAAIVISTLGVLAGCRNDRTPPWTFIAGEVEPGERPEDAAVREVKEETGLLIRTDRLLGQRVHPLTGRTMIYLAAEPTHGTAIFVGDEAELAEVRWLTLAEADELLAGMFEPVREYLAAVLAK